MFDLWTLRRNRRKVSRAYERDRRKLRKTKTANSDELDRLDHSEWSDLRAEDDGINAFLSDQLWEEAREYDIQIPSGEDVWEDSQFGDRKYLSMRVRSELRRLIDEEKSRRFAAKTLWITKFWIPLLAALIGIIGAITGLVAVIKK